jgi:PST family polysaccharide transporter
MTWSVFATAGGRVITLASIAILARILVPADFGLVAVALTFIGYAEAVGDLGTGAALIHWPNRRRQVAQITFICNMVMGALWFAIAFTSAPVLAAFFGSPDGVEVLRALAWVFPLKALGNTHDALMQRDLRFRERTVPEVSLLFIKALVAIPLAIMGMGVWSLVWGQLAGTAFRTAILWAMVPWRPPAGIDRDLLGPVARYGSGIVSVNVLAAIVHHIDVVVVGRMFGIVALGFYQMADKLPDIAVTMPVRAASKVLFPVFSRLQSGGEAMRRMYTNALRYVTLITTPASVGLVLLAEPIVLTVFGPPWLGCVPILRMLAAYAGVRALSASAGDLISGVGRPALLARLAVIRAAVLIPALLYFGRGGPASVAATLVGVTLFGAVLNMTVACRVAGIAWQPVIGALAPGIGSAAVMTVVVLLAMPMAASLHAVVQVAVLAPCGAVTFLTALRLLSPATWQEMRRSIARRAPTTIASRGGGPLTEATVT